MKRLTIALLFASMAAITASQTIYAGSNRLFFWKPRPNHEWFKPRERSFQRVGTFANYRNNANLSDTTVSEIVGASADGRTLVYTDSPMGAIGFINIDNPSNPLPAGKVSFAAGHEPTSVDILGNKYALVAVNSRESFTNTSGYLAVVDMTTRVVVRTIELGGQPDSVKISPDEKYAVIAIENERDELLCAGGADGGREIVEDEDDYVPGVNTTEDACEDGGGVPGGLPQTPYGNPAGYLGVVEIKTPNPASWTRFDVSLLGLAQYAPEDPEPEFVDVNSRNQAVVTLQENNHIAIVDLRQRVVVDHFPAGSVALDDVDATEDGRIDASDSVDAAPREPDAVVWVPGPLGRLDIATANEGDLFGGTRGFSIFRRNGDVTFDSAESLEHIAIRHGHFPESRAENKGTEPEAIEYAQFGSEDYLFVGSERGSFVAVYGLDRFGRPKFDQLLPAPLGPEGLLAIPHRGLLIASGEEDAPPRGVRSTVMIYQLKRTEETYPQIVSDDDGESPIGWSALSGMTSVPGQPNTALAVWDGYYSESRIFRIDVSEKPAIITDSFAIQGGTRPYDLEGIAIAPDSSLWVASEGNNQRSTHPDYIPNLLVHLDADGNVIEEVDLPAAIIACRDASTLRGTLGSGFEGVASIGPAGNYRLLVAQQRGWDYTTAGCQDLDDDDGGLNAAGQPNRTRIWIYDPQTNQWSHVAWELTPKPANAAWVGLSEISDTPLGELIVIERDNLTGAFSELKTLVKIGLNAGADGLVSASEKGVFNLLPRLNATNGWITDKPEGTAVMRDGRVFVVTDNDGVEDWSGESWFFGLGPYWRLFN